MDIRVKPEHRITFVIPAYNAQQTLRRTIQSVLKQTDERYQIILVDDGSVDETGRIGKAYVERYPDRVRYLYQENKRQGGARNAGLSLVETDYVSFLDSDDWLMPDYVERILGQVENAGKLPEIIMTLPVIYHEQSHAVRDWYDKELFDRIFPVDGQMVNPGKELRLYQFEVNVCRKVLLMDFLKRTGFSFREQVKWEDVFPHFYLLSRCRLCMGVRVGFYYRIGESTQTTASGGSDRFDILTVFGDLAGFMEQGHKELVFPVMRVILRFSFWCIHMADLEVRKRLVRELHAFCKRIPGKYFCMMARESLRQYPVKDALQYVMLGAALRSRICCAVFYDYLFQDVCEKFAKKLLKSDNRVS